MTAPDDRLDRTIAILWPEGSGSAASVGRDVSGAAERYLVVPDRRRARFLVPATPRRAAAASVRAYNRLRAPRTRLARAALGFALATGAAAPFLRDHLSVVHDGSDRGLLGSLARDVFGGREIHAAIGVGDPGPFRKPVLQLFDPNGAPLGFVKVGWNEVTRALVATEADLLTRCAAAGELPFATPALLHHGRWRDLEVSVSAPLPAGVRRWHPWRGLPQMRATRAIAALDGGPVSEPVADGTYLRELRRRLDRLPRDPGSVASAASALADAVASRGSSIRVGPWHGDWSPWNFARDGDRFVVWDWEHGARLAPVGFDVLHFWFQLAFIADRRPLGRARTEALTAADPGLRELDADPQTLADLHLLELTARYGSAEAAGAGTNPRFAGDVLDELRRALG